MRHGIVTVMVVGILSACSNMPPREEMLASACAEHPCRDATTVKLTDARGQSHTFHVPAGPVFAGGILSVMTGERQALALERDETGRFTLRWLPESQHDTADLLLGLEQIRKEDGETVSRIGIRNRLATPVHLHLEQYPVNGDRFYPLTIPVVPAERTVYRSWPHTILEIQLTGIQPADAQQPRATQ